MTWPGYCRLMHGTHESMPQRSRDARGKHRALYHPRGETVVDAQRFIGAWRLLSWENRGADGRVTYPFGPDASGYITYTADGHMSVAITQTKRPRFAADDLLGGSAEERAMAAASYVSYAGTYEVGEDTVTHHIEVSLFPNWAGAEQQRFYSFDGDRLTLSTAPMLLGGHEQRAYLIWARVNAAPDL